MSWVSPCGMVPESIWTHLLCSLNCLASDGISVQILGSVDEWFLSMVDHFISETAHAWVCRCVLRRFSHVCLQLWTIFHQGPLATGILQARILEWFAMPSSGDSSWLRDQTRASYVSFIGRWVLYHQCRLGSSSHTRAARCCPWRLGVRTAGLRPGRLCRKAVPP